MWESLAAAQQQAQHVAEMACLCHHSTIKSQRGLFSFCVTRTLFYLITHCVLGYEKKWSIGFHLFKRQARELFPSMINFPNAYNCQVSKKKKKRLEPGTPPRSPTWVAETQELESSLAGANQWKAGSEASGGLKLQQGFRHVSWFLITFPTFWDINRKF